MKIVTHNANFHADDVFAVATLFLVFGKENCTVVRTRDVAEIESADVVVDVGGIYDPEKKRFDHHQIGGAGERENKIPYASFGLVWKTYGEKASGSLEVAETVDTLLVQAIDAGDNGVSTYAPLFENVSPANMSDIIMLCRPTLAEPQEYDKPFLQAVDYGIWIISRWVKTINDSLAAEKKVRDAYISAPDKRLIILPAQDDFGRELVVRVLSEFPEPLYVIHHRLDHDLWQIVGLKKEKGSFDIRKPFPESWLGKSDGELALITNVEDAIFCHRGNFMCVVKSKEGAIKLAELALKA